MRRRDFITLVGGATVAWPLAARAQQASKLRTIGVLGAEATVWSRWTAAFAKRLHELGWVEGSTVTIDYRWSEGRTERVTEIAAEFVRLKVDVIVAPGSAIAREVVPELRRLAIMADAGYPDSMVEMHLVQATARALGLEVAPLKIRRAEDIAPAFAALNAQADALYVVSDSFIGANRTLIITLALGARLPTILSVRDYVQAGGLMSYGPDFADRFRRTAELVDKILHGTKPGDIPVEQPTKFELIINLKIAKALGLTVPNTLLATADEVIE